MGKIKRQTEALPALELLNKVEQEQQSTTDNGRKLSKDATGNKKLPARPIQSNIERVQLTASKRPIKPSVDLFGQLQRDTLRVVDYTYNLIEKFPKGQKLYVGVANTIVSMVGECLLSIHKVCAYNPKIDKEQLLRDVSCKLKTIEDHVEISCRKRYISLKNRDAWTRQLTNIDDVVIGIAMWLESQEKAKRACRDGVSSSK